MTLRDFMDRVKDLPPETPVCVAEVDGASAMNVAGLEVVPDAKLQSSEADRTESVELGSGEETVLLVRWKSCSRRR
jgi:hypothetical protein